MIVLLYESKFRFVEKDFLHFIRFNTVFNSQLLYNYVQPDDFLNSHTTTLNS